MKHHLSVNTVLKLCLFATGMSGIVAEYLISTVATYLLGDSVRQWTLIVSFMLFSMGFGARLSKYFDKNLIQVFIAIECLLSVLVSYVTLIAYFTSSFTDMTSLVVYGLSVLVGLLIGMEIPLVIRINEDYEALKINISSVLENDYYGSLLGGIFFAFVGLPVLGLTYTPFILGAINFAVAVVLAIILWRTMGKKSRRLFLIMGMLVAGVIAAGAFLADDLLKVSEQKRYLDRIVHMKQTPYQRIVITASQTDYFLFINGNQQLSTLDEHRYHEPLVHTALGLAADPKHVLVLGGGDGCAVREVLKYPDVDSITLVDLDPAMTELALYNPILLNINRRALHHPKVRIVHADAYNYIEEVQKTFDVIIADFPDPKSVDLSRLYSLSFYQMCRARLKDQGMFITQATSPYFAAKAFGCIDKTLQAAGFHTLPMHTHLVTLGDWGWVMGAKHMKPAIMKAKVENLRYDPLETRWLTEHTAPSLTAFGKNFTGLDRDLIEVNTLWQPVLFRYYENGLWKYY